ncbi:sushi domain-containing protein 4 [Puma concolor]|uniref:Sushi domain-containing protein 4 n=1 Tax=Puma concolor TaxID=9696 RepID=A0A6P6I238_PUMCO|nr:sushi domain-containing protein 4 [Puma concolor]
MTRDGFSRVLPCTLSALEDKPGLSAPFQQSLPFCSPFQPGRAPVPGFDGLQACTDPGVPENGFRTPSGGVFPESSVTQFHCEDGFKLKGSTKRLCVRHPNGTLGWIPSDKPVCAREDCRVPQVEDAEIRNKTYRHGDKLIITCHEGFKIRYPDLHNMVSLCRDDGTWDNLPLCQGCLRPLSSSNGYVNVSEFQTSFPVGTVISYHCFPGFKLEGSEYLECLHNLIWSSSPPRCLALEVCPLPPTVSHGDFVCHPRPCERYDHGTVVEFYCDPGYSLTSDYKYVTCQYGQWFPSYQVYCIKSEQTWPSTHETLLTTWKVVAFTATSVLLVLLLVILARMFQTKFKAHFPVRKVQSLKLPASGVSGSSEPLQSLYSPSACPGGPRPDSADTGAGSARETASSSPGIDIADEIPLMEEDA